MVRVGIVDSGPASADDAGAMAFDADGAARPATRDRLGHGTAVARSITRAVPQAVLCHAQVFDDRPVTSALRVASAIDWLRDAAGAEVVCLSLGLTQDRAVLRMAVAAAVRAGIILIAAHPARGPSPFPAAYPGVIAATGDARCGWDDVSQLGPALFGAWCNSPEKGAGGMGGASLGAARLTGHVTALVAGGHPRDGAALCRTLARRAIAVGPERRLA